MEARLKIGAIIVGLAFSLTGCAELEKFNNALQGDGKTPRSGSVMAAQSVASQSKPTQLIVPEDKNVAAAMSEALPTIKKILSIHQCLKNSAGLRQMNFYAVPGMDMSRYENPYNSTIGLPIVNMEYHDKNKCLSVQALDQWAMPALNALLFRAVYFADDSGETSNFIYLFKKTDDGSWKIAQFEKSN